MGIKIFKGLPNQVLGRFKIWVINGFSHAQDMTLIEVIVVLIQKEFTGRHNCGRTLIAKKLRPYTFFSLLILARFDFFLDPPIQDFDHSGCNNTESRQSLLAINDVVFLSIFHLKDQLSHKMIRFGFQSQNIQP